MADIAFVAGFHRGERLVWRERSRCAFCGARLPRHAAEPERDDARRTEFQQIPPAYSLLFAVGAHDPSPLPGFNSKKHTLDRPQDLEI